MFHRILFPFQLQPVIMNGSLTITNDKGRSETKKQLEAFSIQTTSCWHPNKFKLVQIAGGPYSVQINPSALAQSIKAYYSLIPGLIYLEVVGHLPKVPVIEHEEEKHIMVLGWIFRRVRTYCRPTTTLGSNSWPLAASSRYFVHSNFRIYSVPLVSFSSIHSLVGGQRYCKVTPVEDILQRFITSRKFVSTGKHFSLMSNLTALID